MAESSGDAIDQRRILVKNLPTGSSEELIINYLEVVTSLGVISLNYRPELLPAIGLATFDEDFTDETFKAAEVTTSRKLLSGRSIVIQRVTKATGILLHDVPLPQTTEEYLELYFEKHLRAENGSVRQVTIHCDIQKAVVLFSIPEVVEHLLQQKFEINKAKVKAESYLCEFHQPILERLLEELQKSSVVEVNDVSVELCTSDVVKSTEMDVSNPRAVEKEERSSTPVNSVKRLTQIFEKETESPPRDVKCTSPTKSRSMEKSEDQSLNNGGSCDNAAPASCVNSSMFSAKSLERPAAEKQGIVDLRDFYLSPRVEDTVKNAPRTVPDRPKVPPRPNKNVRRSSQGDAQTELSPPRMSAAKSLHHLPLQETGAPREVWPGTYGTDDRSVGVFASQQESVFEEGREVPSSRYKSMHHSETEPSFYGRAAQSEQEEAGYAAARDKGAPESPLVGRSTSESNIHGVPHIHPRPKWTYELVEDSEEKGPWHLGNKEHGRFGQAHAVSAESSEKGSADRQTPLEDAPVVVKEMTVETPKLELLSQCECLKNLPCHVDTDEKAGSLCLRGTEAHVRSSQLTVFETINRIEEVSVNLSHSSLLAIVAHARPSLQIALKDQNHQAVICVGKDQLNIVGMSKKEAEQAKAALLKMVVSESLTLDQAHLTFVQSEQWRSFVQKKQEGGLVRVITVLPKKTVYVNGLCKEVALTKKEILSTLKQNATVVKMITVKNPKGKFMFYQCKYQLSQINEKLRSKNVSVRVKVCGREFTEVEVSGLKEVVDEGGKEVKSLEQSLIEFTVDIPYSVTKTKLWRTFSTGSEFTAWIEKLEKNLQCCIQPFLLKTRSPPRIPRNGGHSKQGVKSPAREGRGHGKGSKSQGHWRSLKLDESQSQDTSDQPGTSTVTQQYGQLKLVLKTGDITQEKADVLVNGVNSSLDLNKGQVSRKFLQKAGPQMQEALIPTGIASAGDVVETPGGGQLQCKAVMHVVLERHQDSSSIQSLRDGVQRCLQKSSEHTSLSLPTLGCGHLRFPPKPTAKAIVDEIKQFGQSASSTLRVVTIVVFDEALFQVFREEIQPDTPSSLLRRGIPGHFLDDVRPRRGSGKGYYRRPRHSRGQKDIQGDIPATSEPVEITVKNITVIVKNGNIVKENADILVNVTNRDLDLSRGKVSQSFLKAGGDELQDEVNLSGKAKDGDVVVVPSCGSLQGNCQHIANVVVPRYKRQSGLQVIEKVIKSCLDKAVKEGVNTVAFPSLGCGKLSYPWESVARTMMKEIQNFAQNSSALKTIKIVIYEASVLAVFAKIFKDEDSSDDGEEESDEGQIHDNKDDDEDDGEEDNEEEGEEEQEEEEEELSGAAAASASGPKTNGQSRGSKRSHFVVVTFSEKVKDTKQQLETALEDRFHCEALDVKKYLGDKAKATSILNAERKHLEGVAKKFDVEVQIDDRTLSLEVQGSFKKVLKAHQRMMEILTEKSNNFDKGHHVSRHHNFEEWCEHQKRKPSEPPEYWDAATLSAWKTLKSIVSDNVLAKPSPSVEGAVRKMVMSTWQAHYVGHGRDSVNIQRGMKINIKKVELIQNKELFEKYFTFRQRLYSRVMKKEIRTIDKIKGNNGLQNDILTKKFLTTDFTSSVENDVNEVYLFHGTRGDGVKVICSHGIDFRLASEGGMLGKGVYFAESSTKADQYTDDKANRTHKNLKMVLMRVALGRIYLCEDPNPVKFPRPPCVQCFKEKCDHIQGIFDSVVYSNPSKNFREFVIYANDQCYPEFLITYDRV